MSRAARFAAEVAVGIAVATFGGWAANRLSAKFNRSNQAAERIAASQERIADALDRAHPQAKTSHVAGFVCDRSSEPGYLVCHPVAVRQVVPAISQPPTPDDCGPQDDETGGMGRLSDESVRQTNSALKKREDDFDRELSEYDNKLWNEFAKANKAAWDRWVRGVGQLPTLGGTANDADPCDLPDVAAARRCRNRAQDRAWDRIVERFPGRNK